MKKVGQFERVSYKQFDPAINEILSGGGVQLAPHKWWQKFFLKPRRTPPVAIIADERQRWVRGGTIYENLSLLLPERATTGSAGHDFKAPFTFTLEPGDTIKIPTGVRVKIESGWWLACLPRSSLGFKYRVQLDNTVGVIDGDYYHSDNEGHIYVKITNDSRSGKAMTVVEGEGFAQGIFIPYGVTYDDDVQTVRNGGFGSTN